MNLADLRRQIEAAPEAGGHTVIRTIIEAQPCEKVRSILAGHAMAYRSYDWWADCRQRGVVAGAVCEPAEFMPAAREPGEGE